MHIPSVRIRSDLRRIGATAAAAGALLVASPVFAHADHGQPAHGGIVAEAGVFQGELVVGPAGLTLYLTEHGQPIATQGANARLVMLAGTGKTEVPLAPAGGNRLEAKGSFPSAAGIKAVASVKLADGRAGALRFELK